VSEPVVDYNHIQGEPESYSIAQIEQAIGKRLSTVLLHHYPMRNWAVAVDAPNGVAAVMETDISKDKGYILYLSRPMIELEEMMFKVGGEILERAGLPTSKKFDQDLIEDLPRNVKDDVVLPDLLAPEELRLKK
jgi:hypothetical protein